MNNVESDVYQASIPDGAALQKLYRCEYDTTTATAKIYANGVLIGTKVVTTPPPASTRTGFKVTTNGTATPVASIMGYGTGAKNSFGDNFTRADQTLETSANWTRIDGAVGGMVVASQAAKGTITSGSTAYRVPNRGVARTSITAAIQSYTYGYACVQLTDSKNFIGMYFLDSATMYVVAVSAGISKRIATVSGMNASNSYLYTLTYDPNSGIANVYQNYNLVGTATVAAANQPPVSSYAGLIATANGVVADDVIVEAF